MRVTLLVVMLVAGAGAAHAGRERIPFWAQVELAAKQKAGVLSAKDMAHGRVVRARVRGTGTTAFVVEGAPRKELIEGTQIETEHRDVFLLTKPPGRFRRWKLTAIDELPRPQDRHEILFDLEDGRVLNAWEFASLVTEPQPMHTFLPGAEFGPQAVEALTRHPQPLAARFFRAHREDVQTLMNHIMFVYPREVLAKSTIHRLKSAATGDEMWLAEVPTETFGEHQLYFGDFSRLSKNPILRPHQVARDYDLGDLDLARLGREFEIVESTKPGLAGKTMVIAPNGKRERASVR